MTNIKIIRDNSGFPTTVIMWKRTGKVTVDFDGDNMKITGRLDEEALNILKLILPYDAPTVINSYEGGYFVRADGDATNVIVVIYTVPPGKKLYLLNAFLTSERTGAGASPFGVLYIHDSIHDESIHLVKHLWDFTATDIMCNMVNQLNWPIPAGFSIQVYANADVVCNYGYIGALKDA